MISEVLWGIDGGTEVDRKRASLLSVSAVLFLGTCHLSDSSPITACRCRWKRVPPLGFTDGRREGLGGDE